MNLHSSEEADQPIFVIVFIKDTLSAKQIKTVLMLIKFLTKTEVAIGR
jgi:hypothetical protein